MAERTHSHILTLLSSGSSTWSEEGRLVGSADLPLAADAVGSITADSETLASELGILGGGKSPITLLFHPPDEAAADTCAIMAQKLGGVKTKAIEGLEDPHLGLLEGLTSQAFADRYPKRSKQWQDDPLSMAPPEGEELMAARARLLRTTARLLRKAKSREVALVLHDLNLASLTAWLADRPSGDLWTVLRQRGRVERFLITPAMIDRMEHAAELSLSPV